MRILYHLGIACYSELTLLFLTDSCIFIYESLIFAISCYYLGITGCLLIESTDLLDLLKFSKRLSIFSYDEVCTVSYIEDFLCRRILLQIAIGKRDCREIPFFIICFRDICK